jgi:protein-export SecD/SecF family membrane protein
VSKKKAIILLACITVIIILAALITIPLNGKDSFPIGKSNYDFYWASKSIKLGLDLEGGMYAEYIADLKGIEDPAGALNGAMSNLSGLLFSKGYTEAVVTKVGSDGIRVEVPSVEDTEALMALIGKPAKLEFKDEEGNVLIEGNKHLDRAIASINEGKNVIALKFNKAGTEAFAEATEANLNKTISIYIDDNEIMSPVVNSVISNGEAIIEGKYSAEQAEEYATKINSGALGVKLTLVNSETISPTLGSEALKYSIIAGAVGIVLVMLFMIAIYRGLGLCASLALLIYTELMVILLAIVPWVQLTLPGIAGIILSIGMAVDANVVVFERIKEEMKTGKRTVNSAINAGFKKALVAILDSNITTIMGALVMMFVGASAIKSFAITLFIGILVSMFTSLYVTRVFLNAFLSLQPEEKFYGLSFKEVKKYA